eukprot:s1_g547.t1
MSFDRSTPAAPLAVTMGDPAGIGGDILLTSWSMRNGAELPPFFAIDDPDRLKALSQLLSLDVPIQVVSSPDQAASVFADALPVLPEPLRAPAEAGKLDGRNATSVLGSLQQALELTLAGQASGIVTNPIHKQTLYDAGFEHPGHTEFLAESTGGTPVMMLSCPGLRVVPVTIHIPLADVADQLTSELILARGETLAAALERDFGLAHPRLAVAALNPHGGENGALGTEEERIIEPAVRALRDAGIDVTGPYPADTLFHAEARRGYDAVLAMYHDQALIPLKTIDFDNGVNTTLGLPIVRTSPDHGTACDIAGTGKANPNSFIAALRQASAIAAHRRIARSAGRLDDVTVLEIGPGPGGLTRALLSEGAQQVVAIERDERCISALTEISESYPGRLTIVEGDALELDHSSLVSGPVRIVANLPYNIATPLLTGWLESDPWPPWFKSLTLMFQKEVAERIVAEPGSKAYGRLAILAQWRCVAQKMFDVDRMAFTPPPKVTSSIVHLEPREQPLAEADLHDLQRVVKAAFGQRRKMVRASLKALGVDPLALCDEAGVDPSTRAEKLSIEEFAALSRAYTTLKRS